MKGKQAYDLYQQGYNCSQAVLLAYADELGIDRTLAASIASSFGGGMGKMRGVCGAVTGMFMVAGVKKGFYKPHPGEAAQEHYALIRAMAAEFEKRQGSIICRELLQLGAQKKDDIKAAHPDYDPKRPCAYLCQCAGEILEEYL